MQGCKAYSVLICNLLSFKFMQIYAFRDKILYFCAMRMLTYILAILVLTLSCLPCADASVTGAQMNSVTTHSDQDYHEDACSPFCICACCATSSYVYHTTFTLVWPSSSPNYSFFYVHTLHEISLPIWQPPQLV